MLSDQEQQFMKTLFSKYSQSLLLYSFSMLRSQPDGYLLAEECVQETFETAMRKIAKLGSCDSPFAWLLNTCRKITISKRRKLLNRKRIIGQQVQVKEISEIEDVADCISNWILMNDLYERKQQLFDSLTEQERMVYHAYYESNLSIKECAKEIGSTEGSVRGALQRIKHKLSTQQTQK